MNVNHEVMKKVSEVLKNQEAADKMNKVSKDEELYTIACEYNLKGVSEEDFVQALRDLQEAGGKIELSESELDSVAGGIANIKEPDYTVGSYQKNRLL